jgi:hypothetical protein
VGLVRRKRKTKKERKGKRENKAWEKKTLHPSK